MNVAVILAGGTGERLGYPLPKQFYRLAGKMVIEHSIDAFQNHPDIDEIAVVSNPLYVKEIEKICIKNNYTKVKKILEGGKERYHSSLAAIHAYEDPDINILIHDAVRPLVNSRIISECIENLKKYNVVNVGVTPSDTIFRIDDSNTITGFPFRKYLKNGQSPQAFKLGTIKKAYQLALSDPDFKTTDDCSVVFNYLPGEKIYVVKGESYNMKLTFREDLYSLEKWLHGKFMETVSNKLLHFPDKRLAQKVMILFAEKKSLGSDIAGICMENQAKVYTISRSDMDLKMNVKDAVKKVFKEVNEREGKIDYVVIESFDDRPMNISGIDETDILNQINQGYIETWITARESFQYLKATKGHLLFISSDSSAKEYPYSTFHSFIKAGVENLTQSLAEEWHNAGIKVNCIHPERKRKLSGFGNTEMEKADASLKSEDITGISINTLLSELTGEVINVRIG